MFSLNCCGKMLLIEKPLVMGIINITDDSFYKESRFLNPDAVLIKATQIINEGADILDIGGQSTRPGSKRISLEEELQRVVPVIDMLIKNFPGVLLSIDTYYAEVAAAAIQAWARVGPSAITSWSSDHCLSTR